MKNLGYAGVALGALLSATDLYGHLALDVLKGVNVIASQADVADAQQKWNDNVASKFNNAQNLLIDASWSKNCLHWIYNKNEYYCTMNGSLYHAQNGSWVLQNVNVHSEDYNGWSRLNLNNVSNNQISIWLSFDEDGKSRVVVDGANLNVLCGIKGDYVFTAGNIVAGSGFVTLANDCYSNFARIASPWFCACTHYGSNFNTIEEANIVTGSNDLTAANNFLTDNVINCLGKRNWHNYGTIRFDKAKTDNINYNDHGNTRVKKFVQKGNERNVSVSSIPGLTETLAVKINNLSGTQNLCIEAGEDLGDNTYGYNNQNGDFVSIKTDGNVNFESIPANANVDPQNDQPQNETPNDINNETTQNETPITNEGGHASATTQEEQQVVDDQQDQKKKKSSKQKKIPKKRNKEKTSSLLRKDNEEVNQSSDNDNDNQNSEQQPPADQSNTNGNDADKIQHPDFLSLIENRNFKLQKTKDENGNEIPNPAQKSKEDLAKKKQQNNQETNTTNLSPEELERIKERRQYVAQSDDDNDDEEESSSSTEF